MSNNAVAPEWISVRDAATWLGCHPDTIRRMIAAGELPASRLSDRRDKLGRANGNVRVRLSDLRALVRPIPSAKQN